MSKGRSQFLKSQRSVARSSTFDFGRIDLRHCKSGFTMIELLVVMAIIVVITTISIPTIDSMTSPKHGLRKEGRKIMQLMTEARMAAMSRKVRIDLRIDSETREVHMVEARRFQALETGDSVFQTLEIDTNVFEKTVTFDEDYALEAFTADQIQTDETDDEDSGFQTLETPASDTETAVEQPAVSFTHFGGSTGGGITLVKDEIQLHIAADILTGRPKTVSVSKGESQ
ncbi:prepilin-type N-terminal cleavage/methylation domain-containing protein [Pontiella agarivorans]|uniref:Prepilin-type N-terminal cleavage/methylation domain-containing protein n=1 Tax=Pontiella agarivorans TaxID=3038953 RepID=A0ABU5MWF5_9BACT|nr:prepilin-type N-terminal cleavage/methylation domain-containing protein [Pontiella agarivorans]MDZ8118564.1 prepilin-type N-terminal cleavage/methylation domain-containing protein [Pontiella agarivorans]